MQPQRLISSAFAMLAIIISACASSQTSLAPLPPAPLAVEGELVAPRAALPPGEGVSLNPADAPAGLYALDGRHASLIWRVRHTELGIYVGRFDNISGALEFDPADPARSSLQVSAETASVSTGLLDDNKERSFDARIADILGAERTPFITFQSNAAITTAADTGLVSGALTMNGITRAATFAVTFQGGRFVALRGKHVLAFSARTIIDRSDWEVSSLIFNAFVGDEVEILFEGEFVLD